MEHLLFTATLVAALGAAMTGGLFLAFSTAVMRALGELDPAAGTKAMQAINRVILNPLFLGLLFGTAALALLLAIAAFGRWAEPGTTALLAGALLYLLGGVGVTMAYNVPLNRRLAAVAPGGAEAEALWRDYRTTWTAWNHLRAAACAAAAIAFMLALPSV